MKLRSLPLFLSALLVVGCSKAPTTTPPAGGTPAPAGGGHGALVSLGSMKVGDLTIAVAQEGAFEAGHEVGFDLTFEKDKMPATVRAWVGVEAGTGSVKKKFGKENETTMHGHVEVPKPLPEGSLLWVETESADGTAKASIAFRK